MTTTAPAEPRSAAAAALVPRGHKWLKFPEQRGRPHGHRANKCCPAYRENGDPFPSLGDKTLPIPLQRVVKQRSSGWCCSEPAGTRLTRHQPRSRSASIAAGAPSGRRASTTSAFTRGPCSGRRRRGSPGACPDRRPPQQIGMPQKTHSCQAWTQPWASPMQQRVFLQAPHFCLPYLTDNCSG